jgi:hypothetical protein
MRIRAGDLGASDCTVFLDGFPMDECVEADDGLGYVKVLSHAPDGSYLIENHELVHKTLRGKVTFTWREKDKMNSNVWYIMLCGTGATIDSAASDLALQVNALLASPMYDDVEMLDSQIVNAGNLWYCTQAVRVWVEVKQEETPKEKRGPATATDAEELSDALVAMILDACSIPSYVASFPSRVGGDPAPNFHVEPNLFFRFNVTS